MEINTLNSNLFGPLALPRLHARTLSSDRAQTFPPLTCLSFTEALLYWVGRQTLLCNTVNIRMQSDCCASFHYHLHIFRFHVYSICFVKVWACGCGYNSFYMTLT